MRKLLHPKWIILLNTLPTLALLALCLAQFNIIHTLLPPASVLVWQRLGLGLVVLAALALNYGLWQRRRGELLGVGYGMGALLAYVVVVFIAFSYADDIQPRVVPDWMVPTPPLLYLFTLLMPTLAHAMFVLIAAVTPEDQPQSTGLNFSLAFAVPVLWFVLIQLPTSSLAAGSESFWGRLWGLLYMGGLLSFLFFLTRAAYIIGMRREAGWGELGLLWKILVSLVLPLLGLAVNNGHLGRLTHDEQGIFGNFTSPWFYALAALNALLLCLPNSARPSWRLAQFVGRSALFGYTCYFFVVFLPFLPLAVVAIILIGLGFLMLAPLLLMMVHLRELTTDYDALRAYYSARVLTGAFLAGWAVLPLYVTAAYLHERATLHRALDYVYSPDYAETYHLDAEALGQTLQVVKQHKERRNDFFATSQVPYLSTYFNWLVLDNLTLSDAKITTLERVFLGRMQPDPWVRRGWTPPLPSTAVQLQRLSSTSTFDARQQAWVSWVNLDVANRNPSQRGTEYVTTLALPPGCWVGDYYLNIGRRREQGILAEQKTAAWVFAQIVNENSYRDPGLLTYAGPNAVSLKVYPVNGGEVRRTGVQLLHKEPFVLTVDGQRTVLGDTTQARPTAPVATPGREVAYVSGAAKKSLPLVQRKPYYHFLLDVSAGKAAQKADFKQRVLTVLQQTSAVGSPRFSLVNSYATPLPAGADWQQQLDAAPNQGGFYLDRAIRQTLVAARQNPAPTYPVLVVVTDTLPQAILPTDFADLSSAYPESDAFYVLAADGSLAAHSLRHEPGISLSDNPPLLAPTAVRAWPNARQAQAYLPDTDAAEVVLNPGRQPALPVGNVAAGRWQTGLLLRGQEQWQTLHPEVTEAERVPFIRASFRSRIMTPFTAYLALENDAQKAALSRKQEQVLDANAALDLDEKTTEVPIDEGALLLLLAGVGLGLLLKRGS
ncbi:MSEP-CTERM sorting domain-containing protein [Hymenobacter persicinus]|uniref:MSEP-CTERM sorting domain-containing protein n=1 Tax=Hymenobacter persicinus TaxID=2025506 RepID=A0A4Q5LBG8_9BACT|nr:MSEP-CTERM sorting domain-containing protein [Hymenobacter persicinus]RYU79580.1 MSEP-CTERM sorting domain-containing protein [Hymenobacter persicinus]